MSHHPTGPESVACTTFRGRMSTYLDGLLPEDAREAADAHVAVCEACRRRVDDLETAEFTLARMIEDDAERPLPPGFAGAILARTVHEAPAESRRTAGHLGLAPWLGWIAAAAMLIFTVTLRSVDRPGRPRPADVGGEPAPTVVSASWQISATRDDLPPDGDESLRGRHGIDATSSLEGVASLLDTLAADVAAGGDAEGIARFAAEVIAYDELLLRLERLGRELSPESLAIVDVARGLLEDLAGGDPAAVDRVIRQVGDGRVSAALRRAEWRLTGGSV